LLEGKPTSTSCISGELPASLGGNCRDHTICSWATGVHDDLVGQWSKSNHNNGIIYTKRLPGETKEYHKQRHRQLLYQIFEILEANDLYVKPEKCAFEQKEIKYLGVIIGKGKMQMDPKKLLAVANYLTLKNPTDI
jgi:hypothetical protein